MKNDLIATIELDEEGRLHVKPATQDFPYVYREAMEVIWEPSRRPLSSPVPREWGYGRWFRQILFAASAQGVQLILDSHTQWVNVPASVRLKITEACVQPV